MLIQAELSRRSQSSPVAGAYSSQPQGKQVFIIPPFAVAVVIIVGCFGWRKAGHAYGHTVRVRRTAVAESALSAIVMEAFVLKQILHNAQAVMDHSVLPRGEASDQSIHVYLQPLFCPMVILDHPSREKRSCSQRSRGVCWCNCRGFPHSLPLCWVREVKHLHHSGYGMNEMLLDHPIHHSFGVSKQGIRQLSGSTCSMHNNNFWSS